MPQARDTRHLTGERPGQQPSSELDRAPPAKAKAKAKNRRSKKKNAVQTSNKPVPVGSVGAKEKVSTRLEKSLEELIAEDRAQPAKAPSKASRSQAPESTAELARVPGSHGVDSTEEFQ